MEVNSSFWTKVCSLLSVRNFLMLTLRKPHLQSVRLDVKIHEPRVININVLADYKTDSIIQNTLRTELGGDVTVITVAHRLQTIMDSDQIVRL